MDCPVVNIQRASWLDLFPLAKSILSGHFTVLKAADLIETGKRGATVLHCLNTTVFQDALTNMLDLFGEPEAVLKSEVKP